MATDLDVSQWTVARTVLFTERGMEAGMSPLWWLRLLPLPTHWPQLETTTISWTAGRASPNASVSGTGTFQFTETKVKSDLLKGTQLTSKGPSHSPDPQATSIYHP